jgi:NAD-dependent DNA ligase
VFTGTRPSKPLERVINSRGGKVTSGVSKKTTILVVKSLAGKETKKIKDARTNGTRVLELSEFLETYKLTGYV